MVRPTRFEVRRISLRVMAPAVSAFHGLAFVRSGMMAAAPLGREERDGRAVERFEMPQPIPPYLLAFAVHDDAINIDALLHVKRDPATNESILRSRG